MTFPNYAAYTQLYRRFLRGGTQPKHFIEFAEGVKDKIVLDLCAGGGQLASALSEAGAAHVVMVDSVEEMLPNNFHVLGKITFLNQDVSLALEAVAKHGATFDAAFCRQGINYWASEDVIRVLAAVLKQGAPFIFNTFAECPPSPPSPPLVKQYQLDGKHYVEVSWYGQGSVRHVQCCTSCEPHFTSFAYLSEAKLKDLFNLRS